MIGAEPQQLDAAVRLVLSGSNGSLIRDSWPDLWDSAHRLVRSADRNDLWEALCRLSGTVPNGSQNGAGAAVHEDAAVAASPDRADQAKAHEFGPAAARTKRGEMWRAPGAGKRASRADTVHPGQPSPLLRRIAYAMVALASLLVGIGVIVIIARPHATIAGLRGALRSRSAVELLILMGLAAGGWACVDWLAAWSGPDAGRDSGRTGRRRALRRAAPFAGATLVAVAGVLLLVRGSWDPAASAVTPLAASQPASTARAFGRGYTASAAAYAPAAGISGDTREWALPLAASIIIQGAGLIRPAAGLPAATSPTPTPAPTPAALTPTANLAAGAPLAARDTTTAAVQPSFQRPFAQSTPSSTPVAIARTATPAAVAAAPAVLPPVGFPPPPFPLLLSGSTPPATATGSAPGVRAAVDVRSSLPGGPTAPAGGAASTAADSSTATVAAASPTAPAAHLRFGPPPPSPR